MVLSRLSWSMKSLLVGVVLSASILAVGWGVSNYYAKQLPGLSQECDAAAKQALIKTAEEKRAQAEAKAKAEAKREENDPALQKLFKELGLDKPPQAAPGSHSATSAEKESFENRCWSIDLNSSGVQHARAALSITENRSVEAMNVAEIVALTILGLFALPYLWYFLLRRLREVADAVRGRTE